MSRASALASWTARDPDSVEIASDPQRPGEESNLHTSVQTVSADTRRVVEHLTVPAKVSGLHLAQAVSTPSRGFPLELPVVVPEATVIGRA